MSGQSAALTLPEPSVENDSGAIQVRTSAGVLQITNCKTPGAARARIERLERSFGGIVAELSEQAEKFAVPFRAELIALAGGELPASVQVIAQLAVTAVTTVRKAELLASAALGDWSEARLDTLACETLHERADKSQRNLAGLAIVARDLLQSARAAAIASRQEAAASPTDALMARLGVTNTTGEGQGEVAVSPPLSTGGSGVDGAPALSNSTLLTNPESQ